jgi:hypothetical protein
MLRDDVVNFRDQDVDQQIDAETSKFKVVAGLHALNCVHFYRWFTIG